MRNVLPVVLLLLISWSARAAPPLDLGRVDAGTRADWDRSATVTHRVLLDAPQTQLVTIETVVTDVTSELLRFSLPTWRPGKYTVLDFAGAVQDVSVRNESGRALPIRKTSKATWAVATEGARQVTLRYTVYCNELGVRTRHVDDSHAFLSGSSVFMLVDGRRAQPQRVEITMPDNWRIAGGLDRHPSRPDVLLADSYDTLVDAPLELGRHERYAFTVEDRPHELIVWGAPLPDAGQLVADLEKLAATQHAFWGAVPYGRYVWLLHVGTGLRGGTEHLNSTIMHVTPARLEPGKEYRGFLGLCSHEFFHTWNVKRLRPAGISPYDYQSENYTDLLWVAEGSTSYYDRLLLVRAGLMTPKQYFAHLAERISGFRGNPGRRVQSLAMSSYDAWIKFNQPHDHSGNATVSFYRKGALVNLLLDMRIRAATRNDRSLDDVFRSAFHRFPLGGSGIDAGRFRALLEDQAGGSLRDFFADFVDGVAPLPLEDALLTAGLTLRLKDEAGDDDATESAGNDDENHDDESDDAPLTLGVTLRADGGLARVTKVSSDGPSFAAGVQVDDLLVALDGHRVRAGDLKALLRRYEAGAGVTLSLLRRDRLRTLEVVLAEAPRHTYVIERVDEPTAAQRQVYESWLGQSWPEAQPEAE